MQVAGTLSPLCSYSDRTAQIAYMPSQYRRFSLNGTLRRTTKNDGGLSDQTYRAEYNDKHNEIKAKFGDSLSPPSRRTRKRRAEDEDCLDLPFDEIVPEIPEADLLDKDGNPVYRKVAWGAQRPLDTE